MARWLALLLLVAGCADGAVEGDPDGHVGAPDASRADGGAPAADGGVADAMANPDPSPHNVGWIGGACDDAMDCAKVDDGFCLSEGFPNGMCARECSKICPDLAGATNTPTFCIDGRAHGFDEGLCVARCSQTLFPGTGCPQGYECLPHNRYAEPATVVSVCMPVAPRPCDGEDELVDLFYPDRGKIWIPREARCADETPLVVMLHGINPANNTTPSLGGGRRLELLVRALIDAGVMKPVILAEPVHFEPGSSTLYGSEFSPATHLGMVEGELAGREITVSTLSYVGHSGAGCDEDNGLYKVLDGLAGLIPTYATELRLWGLEDVCYSGAYHYQKPAALAGSDTVVLNVWSVQGDPTEFENGLIPAAKRTTLGCADVLYSSCIRHTVEPWCSYRTRQAAGINHDNNPFFFFREALPQVFPVDETIEACR